VARRRGAKAAIVLLVLLLILGVALVIADRVAAGAAEDQIAAQAKKELVAREVTTASDPKVDIAGFPFLWQVIDGKYEKITIDIERPKINNVQLENLRIVASTVRAEAQAVLNGTGDVVADQISGTASITWDSVRPLLQLAGVPSGIDPSKLDLQVVDNKIQLKVPLTVNGFSLTLTAKGTLVVDAGKVIVRLDEVDSDVGSVPQLVQNLIKQYQDRLSVTVRIPAMPYKLVVNKVETSSSGVTMIATAANVKLAGPTA
jgi:hypothetical protein